jgi:Magnesium chelatase, subunit ChlI
MRPHEHSSFQLVGNCQGASFPQSGVALADGCESRKHRDCYLHGCPCGYAGDPVRECRCSGQTIVRYQKRINGPLLDRIDIHVEVPRIDYEKLSDRRAGEPSTAVRERVQQAREI